MVIRFVIPMGVNVSDIIFYTFTNYICKFIINLLKPHNQILNKPNVVILSAGMSTRMGISKPLLFFDDQKTFIEKITETYIDFGCEKVIVVINEKQEKTIKQLLLPYSLKTIIVVNYKPEAERFYSLKLGLESVGKKACFLQNADNPFIDNSILNSIMLEKQESTYATPIYKSKGGHPILLGSEVVSDIIAAACLDCTINNFLKRYKKRTIEVSTQSVLANIDTQEKYLEYFEQSLLKKSICFSKKSES